MYKFSRSRHGAKSASLPTLLAAALALSTIAPQALAAEPETPKKEPSVAPTATSAKAPTTAKPAATKEAAAATPAADDSTADGEAGPEGAAEETAAKEPTEEEREAAKLSFEAGTKAFSEEDYEAAATEFQKAYEKVPSPHAEYWIARSLDAADPDNENAAEVVAAYSKFLSNPGAQHAGADKVSEAQSRVMELKKLLPAQIKLTTVPEGASVTIDGNPHDGRTPLELELPAGAHKFELSLEGYEPTMVEMDVQGGSAVEQEVTLAEQAPPPEPAAAPEPEIVEPAPKKSLVPAAVTLGLGGAGLISGTIFGIMALGAKKDFDDDPTTANADTAERNALIADMSFGIALTLGITGVVLLTADDEEAAADTAKKQRVLVAPYADKKGGGLAGLFRF